MGHMKDLDRRIRNGGDDAIAAVAELLESREKILSDITDAFTKARWIPVEERLPEDGEPVLAAIRLPRWTDEMPTVIISSYYEHGGFCGDEDDIPRKGVTHWMPLPEPPQP